MDDIRELELKTKEELQEAIKEKEKKGTTNLDAWWKFLENNIFQGSKRFLMYVMERR